MQQKIIRAGVIGVGSMGERHARIYAGLPSVHLAGVYDASDECARQVATRWQTTAYPTVDQLLDEVDAVSIAASTHAHTALATRALEHGVHLLVEKPLAGSYAEAQDFAARAGNYPTTTVQVGYVERFNPTICEVQRLVQGQRIQSVNFHRLSPFDGRCLDSDVVHDLMIHDLDLTLAFCGDQLALTGANGSSLGKSRIDQAAAHLCSSDGITVTLRASRVAERKVRLITVLTDEAWIEADLLQRTISITQRVTGQDTAPVTHFTVPGDEPLRRELEYFLDSVRHGWQSAIGVAAGVHALVYAEKICALITSQEMAPERTLVPAGDAALAAGD